MAATEEDFAFFVALRLPAPPFFVVDNEDEEEEEEGGTAAAGVDAAAGRKKVLVEPFCIRFTGLVVRPELGLSAVTPLLFAAGVSFANFRDDGCFVETLFRRDLPAAPASFTLAFGRGISEK